MTDKRVEAAARALVSKYRKIWLGGGWPAMTEARQLAQAALSAADAAVANEARELVERLRNCRTGSVNELVTAAFNAAALIERLAGLEGQK